MAGRCFCRGSVVVRVEIEEESPALADAFWFFGVEIFLEAKYRIVAGEVLDIISIRT